MEIAIMVYCTNLVEKESNGLSKDLGSLMDSDQLCLYELHLED